MSEKCKRDWEVDAVLDGRIHGTDADAFHAHRATCASCRSRYAADLELRSLARMLPSPTTDEVTARRTRQDVMRAFATRQRAKWRRPLVLALAAALVVVLAWTMRPKAPASLPIATASSTVITPSASARVDGVAARYEHTRRGNVERVTLTDGTVSIHVPHREPGERFIVTLPDGEVEVRGTTFSVTVEAGVTRAVRVSEGRVALRLTGAEEQLVTAPGEWIRPPVVVVASASATQKPGSAVADDGVAAQYESAARLLRERDYDGAASAFHVFVSRHPTRPEAEDAAFLEATALSRAGRRDDAAARAREFLTLYPKSFHAHEAAELAHVAGDE